jgi:hypothetical protein
VHWIATKHALRYLRDTMEYGLRYLGGDGVELQGYTYSDWEGNAIDKEHLEVLLQLGINNDYLV